MSLDTILSSANGFHDIWEGIMSDTKTYDELLREAITEYIDLNKDVSCKSHDAFDYDCLLCCHELSMDITIKAISAPMFEVKQVWLNLAISVGERFESLYVYYGNLMQN